MNQKIMDLIQRRRLQLLVHSCVYYELNQNIVSDKVWDKWAKELVDLQQRYPQESSQVIWHEAFKDWDASTGAFLPLKDKWVQNKAHYLLKICKSNSFILEVTDKPASKVIKKSKNKTVPGKRKLF